MTDPEALAGFDRFVVSTLGGLAERDPERATLWGARDHDDRLTDRSLDACAERARYIRERLADLERMEAAALDPARAGDREVLRRGLARDLVRLELADEPRRRPDSYLPFAAIFALLAWDHDVFQRRFEPLVARLKALPETLAAAERNLDQPARLHVDLALAQIDGAQDFLQSLAPSLKPLLGDIPWGGERLSDATLAGVEALARYRVFLAETILPRAQDSLAMDPAGFARLVDAPLDVLAATSSRAVLASTPPPAAQEPQTTAAIKDAYRKEVDRLVRLVAQSDLVTLPHGTRLRVIEAPAFLRPVVTSAVHLQPPPLVADDGGLLAVNPAPLYAHGGAWRAIVAAHDTYPGHHLQRVVARRGASPLRACFPSPACDLGWALYAVTLVGEASDAGDAGRDLVAAARERAAARARVDLGLHTQGMAVREARTLLVEMAGFSRLEADAELRAVAAAPGAAAAEMAGFEQLLALRGELARRDGPRFSIKGFHDAVLAEGSVPLDRLRLRLLGGGDGG